MVVFELLHLAAEWIVTLHWSYFFAAYFAAMVFIVSFTRYSLWRSGWLSKKAEEQFAKEQSWHFLQCRPSISTIFGWFSATEKWVFERIRSVGQDPFSVFKNLHRPSFSSFIVFLSLALAVFIATHFPLTAETISLKAPLAAMLPSLDAIAMFSAESDSNRLNGSLLTVISALVAVVFALVLFIAEAIRGENAPEQKRVLLRVGLLWPLLCATIFSLLNFLWFEPNFLAVLVPVFVAMLMLLALARVILHLLDPKIYGLSRTLLLQKKARKSFEDGVRRRFANNILLSRLGQPDLPMKYAYSLSEAEKDSHTSLRCPVGYSVLSDINLGELQSLSGFLEQRAQDRGFSTIGETPIPDQPSNGGQPTPGSSKNVPSKHIYLFRTYGDVISKKDSTLGPNLELLALPRELLEDAGVAADIQTAIRRAFEFSNDMPGSEVLKAELQETKDQLVKAINSTLMSKVKELSQTYLIVAEEFLSVLRDFDARYDYDGALLERGSMFSGWEELGWLRSDILDLLGVAIVAGNRTIIAEFSFLPTAIAIRSVRSEDQLLFQEFIGLLPALYRESKNAPEEIRDFLVDRSWRYLSEIAEFHISPEIETSLQERDADRIAFFSDGAVYLFQVLQSLLKMSFDRKDTQSFELFANAMRRLFRDARWEEHTYRHGQSDREFMFENARDGEEGDDARNRQSTVQLQHPSTRIKEARSQVVFGLSSWIVSAFDDDNEPQTREQQDLLQNFWADLPSEFISLFSLYQKCRTNEVQGFWRWDHWDLIADGEVHTIDTSRKVDLLFCLRGLDLIRQHGVPEDLSKLSLDPDLVHILQDSGSVSQILLGLSENSERWAWLVNNIGNGLINQFRSLLNQIVQRIKREEQRLLRESPLDLDKVARFKTDVLASYVEQGTMRQLAIATSAYQDVMRTAPPEDLSARGYNQLSDKGAFTESSRVSYGSWGTQFGRGLAQSRDSRSFNTLVENAEQRNLNGDHELFAELENAVNAAEFTDPFVLLCLDAKFQNELLYMSRQFIAEHQPECTDNRLGGVKGFAGVFNFGGRQIPVVRVFVRNDTCKNTIVVGEWKNWACWSQYSPIEDDEMPRETDNALLRIGVFDLNVEDERRNKLIEADPDWLQEQDNKEDFLRAKVVLNIFEKIKFDVDQDQHKVLVLKLDTDEGAIAQ